jgi:hypothetical protein
MFNLKTIYLRKYKIMKKNLLFIIIFAQMSFVMAQSLVVTGDSVFYADVDTQISHHLDVKNVSNNAINVICQKTIISYPAGMPTWAGSYYCFAGSCYPASATNPSNPAPLNSGQAITYSNNDSLAHSGYYSAGGAPGIAIVEYCFYDQNNPSDNTCVTINYDCSVTAVQDLGNLSVITDFYPNPANGIVFFDFHLDVEAELIIMDILGNEVKSIKLRKKGKQEIDITDLSEGIYFGNLIVNNEITSIKKLIVK